MKLANSYYENYVMIRDEVRSLAKVLRIKKRMGQIRVAFLVQHEGLNWNKISQLYHQMKKDERFFVKIICIPECVISGDYSPCAPEENLVYQWFTNNGYDAVNALQSDGEWVDLQALHFDWVFYLRPYDGLLPKVYRSENVSRFSKVCFMPYAVFSWKKNMVDDLSKEFIRNCRMAFFCTESEKRYVESLFPFRYLSGIQQAKKMGWLCLSDHYAHRNDKSPFWGNERSFKILWLPRYTCDGEVEGNGGSNFLNYYLKFLELIRTNKEDEIVIRPHPLLFSHFVKMGYLSSDEVEGYKAKIADMKNAHLDETPEYSATMWESDVVVCDLTTLLVEAFAMNKPIIFCETNSEWDYTSEMEIIRSACYVSHSEKETFSMLEQIRNGIDPLHSKRTSIINDLFGKDWESFPKDCINSLLESR